MPLPPLPKGFELERSPPAKPDPWEILKAEGFVATSGYRTDADVKRIRKQGYKPAAKGAHNRGDGVDVTHPKLSPKAQAVRLRQLSKQYGWDAKILDEGHHRHLAIPGWGAAPGTPGTRNSGLPPLPKDFQLEQRGGLSRGNFTATGEARDGDTLKLSTGQNGRVRGVDAWELAQQGRRRDNAVVPLGTDARDFLSERIGPQTPISWTGQQSYGRPVVDLDDGTAADVLRHGHGLAVPEYLRGDPRFAEYMEAERLARQNLLGGHGTNAETPEQFRRKDGPWQGMEPANWGEGQAVFADEPTPFYGLRPEIEQGYIAIWQDMSSKPEDLIAYARANGFNISESQTRKQYAKRDRDKNPGSQISYTTPPAPLTDPGDDTAGAAVRGLADPFNVIDELGGVADTIGIGGNVGGPRETLWNSDRRFGDILWNNIDQNRSIIAHDEEHHPVARFGGQLASGVALPYGAGVRTPAALAKLGAIEGAAAGFGAGEGGPLERAPGAVMGTALGAGGGYALGHGANAASSAWRRAREAWGRRGGRSVDAGAEAAPISSDVALAPVEPRVAAMAVDDAAPVLVGPAARERDYINIAPAAENLPPLPEGFELASLGKTQRMDDRLSPEALAELAEGVEPPSVLPRPGNQVGSLDEAVRANPGSMRELQAPDELNELGVRKIPSRRDLYKSSRIRGPIDITQSLRMMGGVKDEGGDLAHLGITNAPRRMEFGSNEQFLGKLIDNERGLSLDEATERLWEEGYFPQFRDRPTPADLLDRLRDEATGTQRHFHPDDLEEVDRFHSAQAERGRIEAAANEGAPLVEEVGESITLDDLVANDPPVGAYEEMPRLTGKLGNINLGRLEKPEDVAQLIDQVQKRVGGFSAASRGRITNEETQRLAQEIGLKPEQLLKRKVGQALSAEQLYATRVLVQKSRELVGKLARKAIGGSDEDLASFRKAWLKHVAIEEQVSGATAEAGRALQQFRMLARAGDAGGEAVRAYLKGGGGRESVEDAAQAIIDLMEDPAQANRFMREAVKPRWRDKINELWINSLLSGPKTHVVNFVGNAVTTLTSLPEQALTAGIGKALRSHDRALIGEVGARVAGLADGAVEGLKRARRAFATGEPQDAVSKVEAAHYQAIGGKLGKAVRIPTRALTASDEWWKSVNASAELRALAYRAAKSQTANPADWQQQYQQLLRDPPEAMVKAAQNAARYYTFQKELGDSGKAIQRWANTWPGAKIILPFVRTPINLLKYAGERSVLGMLMPEVRGALLSGGRARDEALARITIGSGLSTAAVMAALDGRVSGGGPVDPGERAALLQSGWQPYSVRVGDQWVSYQRFDPFSTLIGAAADFTEVGRFATSKEADEFAANLGMAVAKNVTSKTWLSGLSDAFEVLTDPERYGRSYLQRLAGSAAVPSAVNQAAQASDPYMRNARSIVDAIKARVPILSKTVPVRRDVWGEPAERGNSVGPDIASPIFMKAISNDPVRREVARLGAPLSMPPRFLKVRGKRFDLSAQQYDELVQLSGKPAKQYLDGFMQSDEWQRMPDDERAEFVKEALKEFRAAGREELKEMYPELAGAKGGRTKPRSNTQAVPEPPLGFSVR